MLSDDTRYDQRRVSAELFVRHNAKKFLDTAQQFFCHPSCTSISCAICGKICGCYRKAIALREETLTRDVGNARAKQEVSLTCADLARVLSANGERDEALGSGKKAVGIAEEIASRSPTNVKLQAALAMRYSDLGSVYKNLAQRSIDKHSASAQWQNARMFFAKALQVWQQLESNGKLVPANSAKLLNAMQAMKECELAVAENSSQPRS